VNDQQKILKWQKEGFCVPVANEKGTVTSQLKMGPVREEPGKPRPASKKYMAEMCGVGTDEGVVEPLPSRKEAKTTRGAKVRLDGESRGRTAVTNNGGKNSPLACNPRSNKRRQVSLCEHGCFLWFQFGPVVVKWGLQAQHDTLRP
jgi:hypothetical protein